VSVENGELTRHWGRSWPECPPIAHLFRHRLHDRWVRFHYLPLGRRCPAGAADYGEVLRRYNAVLAAVLGESGCAAIYLITLEYGAGDLAAGSEPIHVGLHPEAVPWMHAVDPDDPEVAYDLYVSRRHFTPGDLDDLLRYVADDRAPEVVVTDTSLTWLFHPYDGGMDVIAPSVADRDRLAARFGTWMSDRPDGL
jgi:hypothetical protein